MKIIYVGDFETPWSLANSFTYSLRQLGHKILCLQENKTSLEEILKYQDKADFILYTRTWNNIAGDQKNFFKEKKIPLIGLSGDIWIGLRREKEIDSEIFWKCDYFFTSDGSHQKEFKEKGIRHFYLPSGISDNEAYIADPECVVRGTSNQEHRVDAQIIFVGNYNYHREYEWRKKLLEWLEATYGKNFKLWGSKEVVRGEELNKLYSSVKIVVGDSYDTGKRNYWSDRIYETLGRGGFLLHPYVKGLESEFEIGKEIVCYKRYDFDDLKKKIDYYLEHEEERNKIRTAGFEKVKNNYTYKHRAKKMINILQKEGIVQGIALINKAPRVCKKAKFRILIGCTNFSEVSGMPIYNYRLGAEFVRRGFEVTIVSPKVGGEIAEISQRAGIDCVQDDDGRYKEKEYDVLLLMELVSEKYLNDFPNVPAWYYCHSMYDVDRPLEKTPQIREYLCPRKQVKDYWEEITHYKIDVVPIPVEDKFFTKRKEPHKEYTILCPCTFNSIREPMIRDLTERARKNPDIWVILMGKDYGILEKLDLPKNVLVKDMSLDVASEVAKADEIASLYEGTTALEGWAMGKKVSIYDEKGNYKIVDCPKNIEDHKISNVADEFLKRFNKKWMDIVIPHHDQTKLLAQCLKSVPLRNYNVIIARGGTFGYNCNKGAMIVETDEILFANDDTISNPRTLWELADDKRDLVGVQQLYPDGRKFCLGIFINQYGNYELTNNRNKVRYPSGAYFKIKRKMWEKMGGFNLEFLNGGEDQDLALRVLEAGGKVGFAVGSVIHYESQSTGRYDYCAENDKVLFGLWPEKRLEKVLGKNYKQESEIG